VKHGDLGTAAENGRGEARVEEDVKPPVDGGEGKHGLLPQDPERPVDRTYGLRHVGEVGLDRDQVGGGLAIGEDKIMVVVVDFSQCG